MTTHRPPATEPSLRRNAAWALGGNVGYAACQWAVLVVMARLGTAADVGRFALGLAVTAPIFTFTNLGLRVLQATDANDENPFGDYLALRLVGTAAALVAIAATGLALGYRGTTLALIVAVGIAKAAEAVNEVFLGLFQKVENLRRIALSMLSKGVATVATMALVLATTQHLVGATLAMAAVWGGLFLVQDFRLARRIVAVRPTFHRRRLARLARVALPAGAVASLASLSVSIPRFAVQRTLGSVALGHFAAIAYLLVAGTQPILALGTTVSPRLGRLYHADRAGFRRLTRQTVLAAAVLGIAGVAGAAFVGRPFLRLAYGADYASHDMLLLWLAVAAGVSFVGGVLGYAVTAARRIAEQSVIALAAALVCAVASAFCVPRWGLVGAGWAVLATEVTRLVCLRAVYLRAVAGRTVRRRPIGAAIAAGKAVG